MGSLQRETSLELNLIQHMINLRMLQLHNYLTYTHRVLHNNVWVGRNGFLARETSLKLHVYALLIDAHLA